LIEFTDLIFDIVLLKSCIVFKTEEWNSDNVQRWIEQPFRIAADATKSEGKHQSEQPLGIIPRASNAQQQSAAAAQSPAT